MLRRRRSLVALGSMIIVLSAPAVLVPTATSASNTTSSVMPTSSFSFGAAGDMGGSKDAAATLAAIGGSGTDFFLHVGDLSYDEIKPESAWCDFAKSNLKRAMPYEIVRVREGRRGPISYDRRRVRSESSRSAGVPYTRANYGPP